MTNLVIGVLSISNLVLIFLCIYFLSQRKTDGKKDYSFTVDVPMDDLEQLVDESNKRTAQRNDS